MLTGSVPFSSKSDYDLMRSQIEEAPSPPSTLTQHIAPVVEQAIMLALAKKPEARHQSASAFRAMLLQKEPSAVTRLDAAAAVSYVTRASDTLDIASPSGQSVSGAAPAIDPETAAHFGTGVKETRLAPTAGVEPGYVPTTPLHSANQPQTGGFASSVLGKLNWKHYAGAAVVLVALITVPVVLMRGGGKSPTQPQPSSAAQPATSEASPGTAKPDNQEGSRNGSDSPKPAQPDAGASGQTPQDESTVAEKKADPKEERGTAAKRSGSKAGKKGEKPGGAVSAVGGALKKLGGLFSKKKN
jgi:hypothetical protein